MHSARTEDGREWLAGIRQIVATLDKMPVETTRAAHTVWWDEFWSRSYIRIGGSDEAEAVSRGYVHQRFLTACSGRGRHPIKFNGSIFTVDAREPDEEYNADYRRWGGPYWFQNTRLMYWPMLASGDPDMMLPLFDMYRDALPLAIERTHEYFGHGGAFFPETMYFWGSYANDNYGWDRDGKHISHVDNTYIRRYWSGNLELIALMLDYYAWSLDNGFLFETLLPIAEEVLRFFAEHYPPGSNGIIRFDPAQSLETWHDAADPLPEIAGIQYVIGRLLGEVPGQFVGARRAADWNQLLHSLPKLPTMATDDGDILAPAYELFSEVSNSENPELYAVFPFRLLSVAKPELELALRTYRSRRHPGNNGWRQDVIQAACLGLAEDARQMVVERYAASHEGSRFEAFHGPNFDWVPDQTHASVANMALQAMLLQPDGDEILLFPAWPADWDVEFRLHAPGNTVVEGCYKSGRVDRLEVLPESRLRSVVGLVPQ